MGEMRGNRSGRIRGSEARRERERERSQSICLCLASCSFKLQPSRPSERQPHLQMSALLSQVIAFCIFFFVPGLKKKRKKKSFPCVFCMTWRVGNKMRLCVLVRVVCFCLCKREKER